MVGSGYGILCGFVASESVLMRIQVGRDVVFDVRENQFLEAFHQYWGESHRAVVIGVDTTDFKVQGRWRLSWWVQSPERAKC